MALLAVAGTVVCGREEMLAAEAAARLPARDRGFKLLGLDVLLDRELRPHLLEVNTLPSLHVNTIGRPAVPDHYHDMTTTNIKVPT